MLRGTKIAIFKISGEQHHWQVWLIQEEIVVYNSFEFDLCGID